MKPILLVILFIPSYCFAGQFQFRYGLGIELPEPTYKAQVKHFSIAYQTDLDPIFIQKTEVGMWADDDKTRKSMGFIAHSVGVRVVCNYVYAEGLWGVSLISNTDRFLGSQFQFMQDLGIGLVDEIGRSVGITYKHISNAGIVLPNKGRDAMQIQLAFPLSLW